MPFAPILARTGDTEAWDDGFALYVGADGALGAYVRSGDDANAVSGGALTTNEWNHVALVYSGSSLALYLNGREVASRPLAGAGTADAAAPLGIGTLVGPQRVQPFAGAIADVRIWSSALSASQVGDAYRQFLGETMDPNGDLDGDGLTNLREYRLGRSPRVGARPAHPSLIRSATATTL